MRKLVLLLLLSSCVPFVAEASTMTNRTPPPPRRVRDSRMEPNPIAGPGLPMIASTWHGDQYTLPYNDGTKTWQDLLVCAFRMQSVQAAMQRMDARGYQRRADKDTSFATLGVTTCVISYQIPGVPIEERSPAVIATTRAVQMADFGWMPISIVGGIVAVGDSTDLGISQRPGEEAFTIMWTTEPVDQDQLGRMRTETDWGPFVFGVCSGTSSGAMLGASYTYASMTPAEQTWWEGMVHETVFGAMVGGPVGAISAVKRNFSLSAVVIGYCTGFVSGGIINGSKYVHDNPYPKQEP